VSLTLNVYSHVLPDMGDAAAGAASTLEVSEATEAKKRDSQRNPSSRHLTTTF
jgi:hypothetical protein